MDFRALHYFRHVAQLGSFSKAAAHLHVAQPALSRQVRKLEDELGVELLLRSRRGVAVTEAGAQLLARAEVILRQLEQARREVASAGAEPAGDLVLAVTPAVGQILVPALVRAAAVRYPRLSLRIVEGLSAFIREGLLDHRFDLGLLHDCGDVRTLAVEPLLTEPLYVVERAGSGDEKTHFELSDLECLPLLLPGRPNALRVLVDELAARHGLRLNIAMEIDGMAILRRLVGEGFGCSIMGHGSVYDEVARGTLVATPIGRPPITRRLVVATHLDRRPSAARAVLTDLIRATVKDLVADGLWCGSLPGEES